MAPPREVTASKEKGGAMVGVARSSVMPCGPYDGAADDPSVRPALVVGQPTSEAPPPEETGPMAD